jgi:hypothetical protein
VSTSRRLAIAVAVGPVTFVEVELGCLHIANVLLLCESYAVLALLGMSIALHLDLGVRKEVVMVEGSGELTAFSLLMQGLVNESQWV